MRQLFTFVAMLCAPAVAACVLIRDFDELQDGDGADRVTAGTGAAAADAGAAGGAAGSGGANDTAGAAGSGCDCDDHDPCTRDACDADGRCRHYSNGAILDGLSAAEGSGKAEVVTLSGNAQGFYAAVTSGDGVDSEVTLYSFGPNDTDLVQGPSVAERRVLGVGSLRAVPGAAVALVAEDQAPFNVEVVAAVTDEPSGVRLDDGRLASVWQITLDAGLQPLDPPAGQRLSQGVEGDYVVGQRGPIAWQLGTVHAAWIGAGWTDVHVSTDRARHPSLGDGSSLVAAIAPLGDTSSRPGVLWFTAPSADSYGQAYAQIIGSATPDPIDGCPMEGEFIAAHTSELRTGLWVASWTRATRDASGEVDGVFGEIQMVGCGATGCALTVDEGQTLDCSDQPRPGMYDAVIAMLTPASEPGIVYEALFTPQSLEDGEAAAYLQVVRLDFNDLERSVMLFLGLGREVARVPSGGAVFSPAVAFSGTDRLAVAWVEASSATGQREAHFERYRLCPLTQDDEEAGP
jgi:hypothetical protein